MAVLLTVVAIVIASEQLLQNNNDEERRQLSQAIANVEQHLKSTEAIQQANAIVELSRIAPSEVLISERPGNFRFGAILINRFLKKNVETPYEDICWIIFHEFVQQTRLTNNINEGECNIVSKSLLSEGVRWERRLRSHKKTFGSLLFKGQLPQAIVSNLDCSNINFSYSNMSGSEITYCKFKKSIMLNCALDKVVFKGSSFESTYFSESKATQSDFSYTVCVNTDFQNTDLQGANFSWAKLNTVNFTKSKLDGAIFRGTDLLKVDFQDSSLKNAVFSQVDISSANFKGADLDGADFTNVQNLSLSSFQGAINLNKALLPDTAKPNH